MSIQDILNKYNVTFSESNNYYYINNNPYLIVMAQEVNNEPNNLRIQTENNKVKKAINAIINNHRIQPKVWAIKDEGDYCRVAEFYDALDDPSLLEGNKSLKYKISDFGILGSVNQSTMKYQSKLFYLYNKDDSTINENDEIDIQPQSDIYSFFKNLSYKSWYAISEFVDNSTASYFDKDHQQILNDEILFNNLEIRINYNRIKKELKIEDNAYGMELRDFKRAFRLKDAPLDRSGRNEFGMGLKTAAFWFGRKLTVISTEYGSENEYSLTMDTAILDEKKLKKVKIKTKKVPKSKHGTIVKIGDIYSERDISNGRTKTRIQKELTTIYRRDLIGENSIDKNKRINVFFNDIQLRPETKQFSDIYMKMHDYHNDFLSKNPDYKYKMDLKSKKLLFKEFKFSIEHFGKYHHIKCKIGFLNDTGSANAGLVLYRRGRVIEGGVGRFLKPESIFGAPNSFQSQRLFGEIDLDDIQVSQAKDSFMWSEELQDKIYQEIKDRIEDIIYILKEFKKSDKLPEGHEVTNSDPTKIVKNIIENQKVNTYEELKYVDDKIIKNRLEIIKEKNPDLSNQEVEEILNKKKTSKASDINYIFDGVKYKIQFVNIGEFIKVITATDLVYDYLVEINITHDFFAKFSSNEEFVQIVTEFALAIVAAEIHFEGDFNVDRYRTFINKYISNRGDI